MHLVSLGSASPYPKIVEPLRGRVTERGGKEKRREREREREREAQIITTVCGRLFIYEGSTTPPVRMNGQAAAGSSDAR